MKKESAIDKTIGGAALVALMAMVAFLPDSCEAAEWRAVAHLASMHSMDGYTEQSCDKTKHGHRVATNSIDYNNSNPGLGALATDGRWEAGAGYIARNSMRRESVYLVAGYKAIEAEAFSVTGLVGAISGYKIVQRVDASCKTCTVVRDQGIRPVVAAMVRYEPKDWQGLGVAAIVTPPSTPKGSAMTNLAVTYKF